MKRILFYFCAVAGLFHLLTLSLLAESPALSTTKQAAFFRRNFQL